MTMKTNSPDLLSESQVAFRNLEELREGRKSVKQRVVLQEKMLKDRLQELPGQLIYTGVKSVLPPLISGKITNSVLNGGKALVDHFFVKGGDKDKPLLKVVKNVGFLTAVRWGVRLLLKRI